MDWNNDGKKDLLTGEYDGYVRIYLNGNTDADPVFQSFDYLQMGSVRYDAGYRSIPWICDWNIDGKWDVLCGDGTGKVQLLLNQGTLNNPIFNSMSYVKSNGKDIKISDTSSPGVMDWNYDGKHDLLVGDHQGKIRYYENVGSNTNPRFSGGYNLNAGGSVLDVGQYSRFCFYDWDNDGFEDILCGQDDSMGNPIGRVWYFQAAGPLSLDKNVIQESVGGSIGITLNAGSIHSGREYLMLGSISGTAPGIPLPGGVVIMPLNWDLFTEIVIKLINSPVFTGFHGILDANGTANASFNTNGALPPGSAGMTLFFAYGLNNPWDYVSNGGAIEITF